MKRRLLCSLLLIAVTLTPAFAGSWGFVLDEFDTNNDILIGFAPTFLTAGARYSGLELIDGQSTDLSFILGGGYTQRQVYREADGTLKSYVDELAYSNDYDNRAFNVISGEWKLLFDQGLFWCDRTYDDLFTIRLGYKGRYEQYVENQGGSTSYFFQTATPSVYPESDALLSNTFTASFTLDTVVNDMISTSGFELEVSADYAPQWFLNDMFGSTVDYYAGMATLTSYIPLYQKLSDSGLNVLSIYIADRVRADYVQGAAVPVYAQKKSSLGHKMRGFQSFTYATSLNAVNNFDLRITGPELFIPGLFPRAALYCDFGYYTGHYANSATTDEGMLLSAGAEAALSLFDFLNVGARVNYAIHGDTYTGNDFSYNIFMVLHY